ncbi:MAG: dethiobiotin synthase [Sphingobacterium sp.]
MDKQLFITGIGTGVGKTIVSAVLCRLWNSSYWKPVQSGDLETSDSITVRDLLKSSAHILPERYRLQTASSPHDAARRDGMALQLVDFHLPKHEKNLLIEGAGGLFVPLNEQELMIDLIEAWNIPVIIVCSEYLGSINHSLLSFYALQQRNIQTAYVVLNGIRSESTARILREHRPIGSGLIELPWLTSISSKGIDEAIVNIKITNQDEFKSK